MSWRPSLRLAAALMFAGGGAFVGQQLTTGAGSVIAAAPQTILDQAPPQDRTAKRARYAAVSLDQLPQQVRLDQPPAQGSSIVLELFPDVTITAVRDRFDPNNSGITWVGHAAGIPGSTVTLVYSQGLLTGSVALPDAVYSIRPAPATVRAANPIAAGVLHVITEVDQSQAGQELEPIRVAIPEDVRIAADAQPKYDTGDFIDVLVVYTPSARAAAGGTTQIESLINLGVSETNTSYANSGVVQRIRLAGTAEVAYTEDGTGNLSNDLSALRNGTGPGLSGVAALRNSTTADLVTMLTNNTAAGGTCGVGYFMGTVSAGFESNGYNVVEWDCVSPNYSFAHELGHNMGLMHDWYVDDGTAPYTYAHGHVNTVVGNRFRTIMGYNNLCSDQGFNCTRILYWSNPSVQYNGTATGIPGGTNASCTSGSFSANTCDADDHLALNNTALTVANFRQAGAPPPGNLGKTAPAAGASWQALSLTLSWGAASGATSYDYCIDTTDNNQCNASWVSAGAATSIAISGLATNTVYFWQVRANNGNGSTFADGGLWWSFGTLGAAGAQYDPTLKVPKCVYVGVQCDTGLFLINGVANVSGGPEPHQPNTINNSCSDGTGGALYHDTESIDRLRVFTVDGQPLAAGKMVTIEATVFPYPGDPASDFVDFFYAANASSPTWTYLTTIGFSATGSQTKSFTYTLPAGPLQAVRAVIRYQGAAAICGTNSGFDDYDDLAFAVGPAPNSNIMTNGGFASGETNWLRFSTPDATYFQGGVVGGQMRFYRPAPPPGTPSQAVIFQNTGLQLAANAPVQATFDLGNTDGVDKRMSILIHDADFSDLSVCTVWIPAGTSAPVTYTMLTHTTKPWTNATISFYAASANPSGNTSVFILDNVTLQHATAVSTVQTTCQDPFKPTPPSGVTGADMLSNGTFATGTTSSWSLFGQIASQVTAGVLEFRKLPGTPAGVILQSTGQAGVDNQIYTSTFQLGNSSNQRQRVTIIMHDLSFGDLSACTFWIAPNTPLTNYAYRAYATKAWTNATLSVYPATANGAQWLLLDNVTFTKTATANVSGAHCIEPGGALP